MRFHFGLPPHRAEAGDEFIGPDGIAELARAAEDAGFVSFSVTEHPFPWDEWLNNGGHHALDPFVALAFAASATSSIGLLTYVCIVPYRNPFLVAKSAASVDVLSRGRMILGVGAGHLEAEFRALGVDFSERNELLDEGLVAIRRAWTEAGVQMTGRHFDAQHHTALPAPVQSPHPPIWVGGNAKRALRRSVDLGDGWLPMINPRSMGARRHSAHLENVDDLSRLIAYAQKYRAEVGKTGPYEVVAMPFVPASPARSGFDLGRFQDHVEELSAVGVTGLEIMLPAATRAEMVESISQFGAEVISSVGG